MMILIVGVLVQVFLILEGTFNGHLNQRISKQISSEFEEEKIKSVFWTRKQNPLVENKFKFRTHPAVT